MRGVALLHAVRVYLGRIMLGTRSRVVVWRWRGASRLARLAREYNDTQVVGVGAWMHGPAGPAGPAEMVEAFLATLFSGGERHARWIRLVADFEAAGDAPPISAG